MKILTIVIVAWNVRELVRECLESIRKYQDNDNFEIIYVDNASSDGTVAMIKEHFPGVRILENSENLGFTKANNQAIAVCKGKYILLLNSDTLVLDDALDVMVNFLEQNPDVGVCGAKLLNADKSLQISYGDFPTMITTLASTVPFSKILPKSVRKKSLARLPEETVVPTEVDYVSGACLMVRREVLEEVGLMDEQFVEYFNETDWCLRIKNKGWKICYIPDAQIIHYGGHTMKKDPDRFTKESYKSMYKFFRKHYGNASPVILRILLLEDLSLRLWFWRLKSFLNINKRLEIISKIASLRLEIDIVNAAWSEFQTQPRDAIEPRL